MIGKLRGRVDEVSDDSLILDVNGVGYNVHCSTRTLAVLPSRGELTELIIETQIREDAHNLFGFPDSFERDWFRLLNTVQGVGAKMALALLSAFSPEQIAVAIAARDVKALTRVSGVGPKLAERLVTELKSKVAKLPTSGLTIATDKITAPPTNSVSEDAVSALSHLGYSRTEAFTAVARAAQKLKKDSPLDTLIKEGLKELATG